MSAVCALARGAAWGGFLTPSFASSAEGGRGCGFFRGAAFGLGLGWGAGAGDSFVSLSGLTGSGSGLFSSGASSLLSRLCGMLSRRFPELPILRRWSLDGCFLFMTLPTRDLEMAIEELSLRWGLMMSNSAFGSEGGRGRGKREGEECKIREGMQEKSISCQINVE